MRTITLEKGLATFLDALSGKNRSAATIRAYQTDIAQFISFLHANNVLIHTPAEVEKIDVMEYLSALAKKELTGIARARKMSAIREYFRFLEGVGLVAKSPTTGIETPKREKNECVPPFTHLVPQPVAGLSLENPQRPRRDTLSPGRSACSAVGLLQT
jgi:site-specific recombinase XerD